MVACSLKLNCVVLNRTKRLYSSKLKGFDMPTVWQEFSGLATEYKAVNLGQGFPDWVCPEFAKKACQIAIESDYNQYARSAGDIALVQSIAKHYSPLLGRSINPLTEIITANGATEALFAAMLSILERDDEVIILEPTFDVYPAQVQMVGGICKYLPLTPPTEKENNWSINISQLENLITNKTKILLLNTPHNPTGKILTHEELYQISLLIQKYPNIIVITDEVYENLIFDNKIHTRFATLPHMWNRTITITSAGKTFSITGWKVGWAIGPQHLIQPIFFVNQWTRFCVNTPCQRAIASMLDIAILPYDNYNSYYQYISNLFQRKRDRLIELTKNAGLKPLETNGGYFLICDTSNINMPDKYLQETDFKGDSITRDWAFC
eukprot:gene10216-21294_t